MLWLLCTSSTIQRHHILNKVTYRHHLSSNNRKRNLNWEASICAVAGAISCSLTHSLVLPLDVVKTRLQNAHRNSSPVSTMKMLSEIAQKEGWRSLFTGLSATATGYFLQGAFKFGFYEFFKSKASKAFEKYKRSTGLKAEVLHLPLLFGCSALAESIASFALCPLEATKIFMVMNPEIARSGMLRTMSHMVRTNGLLSLYTGITWILLRQIPYTSVKLVGYDVISHRLRALIICGRSRLCSWDGKEELHRGTIGGGSSSSCSYFNTKIAKDVRKLDTQLQLNQFCNLMIQLGSGVMAGVLAACVSQPADVVLSRVCAGLESAALNVQGATATAAACSQSAALKQSPVALANVMRDLGLRRCFSGLKSRAMMVAALTAMQFLLYENTKEFLLSINQSTHIPIVVDKKGSIFSVQ